MKSFFRWVALLPAAAAAFVLIELLNSLIPIVPNIIVQWWNCWAGAIGFVLVGCYVAPKYKFIVSIVLGTVICIAVGFSFFVVHDMPIWNLIICGILNLLGAFIGCRFGKEFEEQDAKQKSSASAKGEEQVPI